MSIVISLFILGITLSIDTFSISLSIGTFLNKQKSILLLCVMVGFMHFIMPILGFFLGIKIVCFLKIDVNILLGLILLFLSFEMIINIKNDEPQKYGLTFLNTLLISISVSFDSFSTGIGLGAITNNYFLAGLIFSICAASFTFLGCLIGKYSTEKLGIYAKAAGLVLLIIVSIIHLMS